MTRGTLDSIRDQLEVGPTVHDLGRRVAEFFWDVWKSILHKDAVLDGGF